MFFKLLKTDNSNITRRIVSGSFWVLVGTIVSKIMVFVATIIVARILSKEVYGQLGIIRSTIQLFVGLTAFGIGATATKHIAQYRISNPHMAVRIYCIANIFVFLMGLIACIILISAAGIIANHKLNAPELAVDIRIAGIILFFTLINGAQTGTLSGFEDFKRIATTNLIMGCSEIILLCIGAKFFGLVGAILGFGFTYFIAWCYNTFYIRKHICSLGVSVIETIKTLRFSDFKVIYSFSLPIAISSWITMGAYWWVKTWVVQHAGFENMANYDVAEQWKSQLLFIPGIVANVLLPILSSSMNNKQERKIAIKINLMINLFVTGILFFGICIFGHKILSLYGGGYTNLTPLYILAFAAIIDSVSNLCGTIVISSGQAYRVFTYNVIWAVVIISAYLYFAKSAQQPENSLAFAYLIASIVQTMFMCTFVIRNLKRGNYV